MSEIAGNLIAFLMRNPSSQALVDFWSAAIVVLKALVTAFLIGKLYQRYLLGVGRESDYSRIHAVSFFVFTLGMAMVVLVMRHNILGAFSLIGAISLIRFRAVIKSSFDCSMYFLCLVVGMTISTHVYWVSLLSLFALYIAVLLFPSMMKSGLRQWNRKEYLYSVTVKKGQESQVSPPRELEVFDSIWKDGVLIRRFKGVSNANRKEELVEILKKNGSVEVSCIH